MQAQSFSSGINRDLTSQMNFNHSSLLNEVSERQEKVKCFYEQIKENNMQTQSLLRVDHDQTSQMSSSLLNEVSERPEVKCFRDQIKASANAPKIDPFLKGYSDFLLNSSGNFEGVERVFSKKNLEIDFPLRAHSFIQGIFEIFVPLSWASMGMTKLLSWRNTQCLDEKTSIVHKVANRILFALKIVVAEIAHPLLFICGSVETLGYSTLWAGSLALGKKDSQKHYFNLLKSSTFTTLAWIPTSFFFYNLFSFQVVTNELKGRENLKAIKAKIVG